MVMSAGSRLGRTRFPPGAVPAAAQKATTTTFSGSSTSVFTMAGIGLQLTPKGSGSVVAMFSGWLTSTATTANLGIILQIAYGTGTPPAAGAAATGTLVGEPIEFSVGTTLTAFADERVPIALQSLIQNLNVGVTYWFDLQVQAITTATDVVVNNPVLTVVEQGSGVIIPGPATVGGTPTTQSLTSGTGATYTTPAGVKWLEVFMVGSGGGGTGASSTATTTVAGTTGNTSTFNSVNAAGGSPGAGGATGQTSGGAGGTGGTGAATRRQPGEPGDNGAGSSGFGSGGNGGSSFLGGGARGIISSSTTVGVSGAANSGGGGAGAINTTGNNYGGGGGGGEFVYMIIPNPAATYTYTVGAAPAGGASTTNGGAGGSGFIFVIEHYT
jgi:hypothetical protein